MGSLENSMYRSVIALATFGLAACGGSDISVKAAGEARCNGVLDEEETAVDGPFDADGDGYFNGDNPGCLDTYPAEELDCDDSDPEVGGPIEWYPDGDGDGFGTVGETMLGCEPDLGFSATADDCDDTRASTYPGADEYCDGEDNDCDDLVDEDAVDGLTFFRDADEDSYGTADDTTSACDIPDGYAAAQGDCDDADAELNPAVEELCFDDLDNNCDGEVDEGCDVDFTGAWDSDTPISYSCAGGAVNISFDRFSVIEAEPTISFTSIGSAQPGTMSGTINPDGWGVNASISFPGTCNEDYTVTGSFSDIGTFSGTFQASFSGWTCLDCTPQLWPIILTR
jgi:hypothetical protein